MTYEQTNGIPQGSVLMDFIAEIVLGYSDAILSCKLKRAGIYDYHIIRYRDDYRIFTNNQTDGETILKILSDVLRHLGLKLNIHKTFSTNELIAKSIKREKLEYIPINHETNTSKLLYIYQHGQKYPNAGHLKKLLTKFLEDIKLEKYDDKVFLLSLITDIAYNNPCVYPQASAIISHILDSMGSTNVRKSEYIKKIINKFARKPNTSYMDVWIQRFGHFIDVELDYKEKLCDLVKGKEVALWNNDWLTSGLSNIIQCQKIVDKEILSGCQPIIPVDEVSLFKDYA